MIQSSMISGLRVLWRALVHLYDESLLMIRANVIWFVGSVPLLALVLALTWLSIPADPESGSRVWPLVLAALIVLVLPSPFALGVYALAAEIVAGDTPELAGFWRMLRRWWWRGLAMFCISGLVLITLTANAAFYLSASHGVVQAIGILWLYGILFWLTMQGYLVPLLAVGRGTDVSLRSLYKRAAVLTLAHPLFSLALLGSGLLMTLLTIMAPPVYPLLSMAYVALVGTSAVRQLQETYLPPALDSEDAAR